MRSLPRNGDYSEKVYVTMGSSAIQLSQYLDRVYSSLLAPDVNYGQISCYEAEFLMRRVLEKVPSCIVEIGTASGGSAAHMLAALRISGAPGCLHTFEYLDYCYFDKTKKPAFLVEEIFGTIPENFHLHLKSSAFDIGKYVGAAGADLLFVDGNHSHPWATLDMLLALPYMAEDATIVFHDINLHLLGGEEKKRDKGPHYAFYHLRSFNKIAVALRPYPNIGSLEINGDKLRIADNLLDILFRFEWENHSWPVLDQAVLEPARCHIEEWWGADMARKFSDGLEKIHKNR